MVNDAFDKYVNNFDLDDKDIQLKYNHSYRVADLSKNMLSYYILVMKRYY